MSHETNWMDLRAIDRLVAEKVMGWERLDDDLPRYSEDIAAAWEVLDKLGCVIVVNEPSTSCTMYANYRAFEDGISLATAPTAPLAICLAALQARGVEVPE